MVRFLLEEWKSDKYATKLRIRYREVLFVCEEKCMLLFSETGEFTTAIPLPDLYSSQAEETHGSSYTLSTLTEYRTVKQLL